jgi:hypothetical protein
VPPVTVAPVIVIVPVKVGEEMLGVVIVGDVPKLVRDDVTTLVAKVVPVTVDAGVTPLA